MQLAVGVQSHTVTQAAGDRALLVLAEPLGDVGGVAAMATCLTPREPAVERRQLSLKL